MKSIRQLAFEVCKKSIYQQFPEEFHRFAPEYMPDEKIRIVSDSVVDSVEYSLEDELRREVNHVRNIRKM